MKQLGWKYVAARLYLRELYKNAGENRSVDPHIGYGSFYHLIQTLTEKGIYSEAILTKYTKDEIDHFQTIIDLKKTCYLIT